MGVWQGVAMAHGLPRARHARPFYFLPYPLLRKVGSLQQSSTPLDTPCGTPMPIGYGNGFDKNARNLTNVFTTHRCTAWAVLGVEDGCRPAGHPCGNFTESMATPCYMPMLKIDINSVFGKLNWIWDDCRLY
jgi:hypothetical protein